MLSSPRKNVGSRNQRNLVPPFGDQSLEALWEAAFSQLVEPQFASPRAWSPCSPRIAANLLIVKHAGEPAQAFEDAVARLRGDPAAPPATQQRHRCLSLRAGAGLTTT
jgi:hypothetical protein